GLEFASMYASFGSEVTVFEGGPVLMPREDRDVADSVRETLEKKGIVFRTGADVLSVRDSGGAAKVSWRQAGEGRVGELEADAVL
ncbi:NAD-binding protein, partial [Alistipes sp.]